MAAPCRTQAASDAGWEADWAGDGGRGTPGQGGISWDEQGEMISGEAGVAVEMRRFPE